MMLTMYQTPGRHAGPEQAMQQNATAMGQAFDASKNDDSFYLPPEVFDNPDFKRGLKMFVSPDGKAVRFIISHEGDPATAEGISHIDAIKNAAFEAIKGTPLEGSKIYLGGTAATYKDMQQGSNFDLLIAGIASLCLIFIIMLILTRSVIAAAVIVGTVLLSLGTSFGLSVLIWQYILGMQLHWMIIAMSVIILLAVGSDYNLLLVSRFKEEIHAGIEDRNHPLDGRHGRGRDVCRPGVRVHHDVDGGQRPTRGRSGGHNDRFGSAVRHAGHTLVHDAVNRRAARPLVLVAAERAHPPRASPASSLFRLTQLRSRSVVKEDHNSERNPTASRLVFRGGVAVIALGFAAAAFAGQSRGRCIG